MAPVMQPEVKDWLHTIGNHGSDPILEAMHAHATERGFPIIGPEVGRLLAQMTKMTQAKRIFELGSGFGYSTLWFARSLGDSGTVYHTDGDAENTAKAKEMLTRAGVVDRVDFFTGDARKCLQRTDGTFDIIFCDIYKDQYPSAYELMRERVRPGGVIIIDNLIWNGRVATGNAEESTQGVRQYIDLMWNDPNFLSSLLPIRDGVGLSLRLT
jgi:caffeoyl-CoA O-methyltransferase